MLENLWRINPLQLTSSACSRTFWPITNNPFVAEPRLMPGVHVIPDVINDTKILSIFRYKLSWRKKAKLKGGTSIGNRNCSRDMLAFYSRIRSILPKWIKESVIKEHRRRECHGVTSNGGVTREISFTPPKRGWCWYDSTWTEAEEEFSTVFIKLYVSES